MKAHISTFLVLVLLLLAGQAGASYWFKVIDISPSPIEVSPGGSANFTVLIKGLGSDRAYVQLVFKNKTQGLDLSCDKNIKNIYPAGVTDYNCSVQASADIAPGNYSFVVDAAAKSAPSGKMTGYINVIGPGRASTASTENGMKSNAIEEENDYASGAEENEQTSETSAAGGQPSETQETPKKASAPGILASVMAMALMAALPALSRYKK